MVKEFTESDYTGSGHTFENYQSASSLITRFNTFDVNRDNVTITGSLHVSNSIDGKFIGDFSTNVGTKISGSFNDLSSSFSTRVTTQENRRIADEYRVTGDTGGPLQIKLENIIQDIQNGPPIKKGKDEKNLK